MGTEGRHKDQQGNYTYDGLRNLVDEQFGTKTPDFTNNGGGFSTREQEIIRERVAENERRQQGSSN